VDSVKRFWAFVGVLFSEGMLRRTTRGENLGFASTRVWGANMMFAGLTGALIGVIWLGQRAHFEYDAVATTSTVLDVSHSSTRKGKSVYQLTLEWTDQTGHPHVTTPNIKASFYNVPVGTELDIKYDPNDLTDVRVETQEGPWYFPRLILIGSVMSFVFGWVTRGTPQT
jgi:hypothetical protein